MGWHAAGGRAIFASQLPGMEVLGLSGSAGGGPTTNRNLPIALGRARWHHRIAFCARMPSAVIRLTGAAPGGGMPPLAERERTLEHLFGRIRRVMSSERVWR